MGDSDPQTVAARAAEEMYARDDASQGLGMRIEEIAPGRAVMSMQVRADMVNGHKICHGGFIFLLADSAFAFACNSYNRSTVAAQAEIDFLAPAKLGDTLTATSVERHRRGRSGLYDSEVVNQDGAVIAQFRGRCREIGGVIVEGLIGDAS